MRDTMIYVSTAKLAKLTVIDEAEKPTLSSIPAAAAADTSFSTPEAKEHQIPKPITCPPAPLRPPSKRKLSRSAILKATRKFRAAREFFLSPEIEAALVDHLFAAETARRTPKRDLRTPKYFR
ncbi:unnamed protein product [Linum trigynum]|uniref:Uncharacterized protein n=1 Tax=Linum trigynum TaxID=586398 RepID=A0AAV2C8D4_9ROSI